MVAMLAEKAEEQQARYIVITPVDVGREGRGAAGGLTVLTLTLAFTLALTACTSPSPSPPSP